jgi:glutamine amidotransferase
MVAIIDYGLGNLASVQKALNALNLENIITSNSKRIKESSSVILPGVGSFTQGIKNLRERNLDEILYEEVMEKKKAIFRNLFRDAANF